VGVGAALWRCTGWPLRAAGEAVERAPVVGAGPVVARTDTPVVPVLSSACALVLATGEECGTPRQANAVPPPSTARAAAPVTAKRSRGPRSARCCPEEALREGERRDGLISGTSW
jgi:hypothetical protein